LSHPLLIPSEINPVLSEDVQKGSVVDPTDEIGDEELLNQLLEQGIEI
jgi:hypothetical protein